MRLTFDDGAAFEFARLKKELRAAGTPIGPMDLLIAAITVASGGTLVTNNAREFGRVRGLRLAGWAVDD